MIAPLGWLGAREESSARRLALAPLDPLAWIYGACARLHRGLYGSGWRRQVRLECRVVSVGNLVVGGAGKTPAAAWLAVELHRRGHKVVLGSRGYRRRGKDPVHVVTDGRRMLSRAERAGDEPMVLASRAPGIPVLVGRDRALVGWRALAAFGADVLVLDDGFQHHRLRRDVDIVLFDAGLGFGNGRLLPRGPLREPASAVCHADAIGVVDGALPAGDEALLARYAPAARRFTARRRPAQLRPLRGGLSQAPDLLRGREVGMLCALAFPRSLRRTLERLGARVVAERTFRDHHRYRARDLARLTRDAPLWVTTEKDSVKLVPSWAGDADVRVLSIDFEVEQASAFADWVESRIR